MELWGGVECTVNRVGDRFRDQTIATGREDRPDDLHRFAALGITALRYPVLWKRIAPDRAGDHNWRWTDERFLQLLDGFAGAAARYLWVKEWTPVHEPLTTARFSALYGVWYPNACDKALFWRALINQVDAVRLSMRAIRQVNARARLVQTEELGHTHATEPLGYQADYNDARRWGTWDLLTGRVRPDHPVWADREGPAGRPRARHRRRSMPARCCRGEPLRLQRPLLDHRLDRYDLPAPADGYHDLTAAHVMDPPTAGLTGVLREA